MITNEDTKIIVKETFTNMEKCLNGIEDIYNKGEADTSMSKIGYLFGMIKENYKTLVSLLNIYSE